MRSRVSIQREDARRPFPIHRFLEEAPGCRDIPPRREQEMHCLTLIVDGPMQEYSAALLPSNKSRHSATIRLPPGHTGSSACRIPKCAAAPTAESSCAQFDATLAQHAHQITRTQFVAGIPPDTQDHHLAIEVQSLKQIWSQQVSRRFPSLSNPIIKWWSLQQNRMRKGQVRWLPFRDVLLQIRYIVRLSGLVR